MGWAGGREHIHFRSHLTLYSAPDSFPMITVSQIKTDRIKNHLGEEEGCSYPLVSTWPNTFSEQCNFVGYRIGRGRAEKWHTSKKRKRPTRSSEAVSCLVLSCMFLHPSGAVSSLPREWRGSPATESRKRSSLMEDSGWAEQTRSCLGFVFGRILSSNRTQQKGFIVQVLIWFLETY